MEASTCVFTCAIHPRSPPQVLRLLIGLYKDSAEPDWAEICQCLMFLDDAPQVAAILQRLVAGNQVGGGQRGAGRGWRQRQLLGSLASPAEDLPSMLGGGGACAPVQCTGCVCLPPCDLVCAAAAESLMAPAAGFQ
jgi:hypothetical protein